MSKEKDMLHEIAVEARRDKLETKYKKWFDEMLIAAKNGEFGIRWRNTEEEFPQELAKYLLVDLEFRFYRFTNGGVFDGIIDDLRLGWRDDNTPGIVPGYVEVSW